MPSLPIWWLQDAATQAVRAFNDHVRSCRDCAPLDNVLCWLGDELNDEASTAAARAIAAQAEQRD